MIKDQKYRLEIFKSTDALNIAAVEFIIKTANKAVAEKGRFIISLSGGETPKKIFTLLAQPFFSERMPWKQTFIFWGDERCVPLDDERNNAHQATLALLDKIDIPVSNIYIIPVNLTPGEAATKYEQDLNIFFGEEPRRFDLILLGLGENGHTASLFPGTEVINETQEGVRAIYVEADNMFRVTMTAPLINQAHQVLFLVTGKTKAGILKKVLTTSYQPGIYPAQLIKPIDGELYWFVDAYAASQLNA
jgi:6-phosphogluconolactonase